MRSTLVAAGALAALAVAAPAASADTFCVSDPQCVAAGNQDGGNDLAVALGHVKAHAGPDSIVIGPGTFTGPFAYVGVADPTNTLEIHGAGQQTILTLPQGPNLNAALTLDHPQNDGVMVSDLRIKVPGGSSNTGLSLTRGVATKVDISFGSGNTNVVGANLTRASLRQSEVTVPADDGSIAVETYGDHSGVVDSTLRGDVGVYSEATSQSTAVTRTRIVAAIGIGVGCGNMLIQDVSISGPSNTRGVVAGTWCAPGNTDVEARHLTALGGPNGGEGVIVQAAFVGATAKLRLLDSTLTGYAKPLVRSANKGMSNLVSDWSNYSTVGEESANINGGTGTISASNRIDVAPGFVDPAAGDLRLSSGSPLIDAGDPASLEPFESATDLAGQPRLVAGTLGGTARRDIGANEYQPPPAPIPDTPPAPEPKPDSPAPPAAGAPKLTLSGAKRQHVRRQRVVILARADQAVTLQTKGSVKLGRRSFRLRAAALRTAAKGSNVKLSLAVSKGDARTIRRLLVRRRARATVTVTAVAASGLKATAKRQVTLVR